MARTIVIGIQQFNEIREKNYFMWIKLHLSGNGGKKVLILSDEYDTPMLSASQKKK